MRLIQICLTLIEIQHFLAFGTNHGIERQFVLANVVGLHLIANGFLKLAFPLVKLSQQTGRSSYIWMLQAQSFFMNRQYPAKMIFCQF